MLANSAILEWLSTIWALMLFVLGLSIIIFFHELGHFLAAKWVGVRVHRFAVGFGKRLFGYRGGEGFTFGTRPEYSLEELAQRKFGETDYCMNLLPIGGYVKMLGQDDIIIDEKDNVTFTDDPRAFNNRTVGQRMFVVSMGVVFNLLFAALAMMLLYLIGVQKAAPVIGEITSTSPARGLLHEGDRIIAFNGARLDTFEGFVAQTWLSDGAEAVRLKVQRQGKMLENEIVVTPRIDPRTGIAQLELLPMTTTRAMRDGVPVNDYPNSKEGDVWTHVDGQPVETAYDISRIFGASGGRILPVRVKRPKPNLPGEFSEETVQQRAYLRMLPAFFASDPESETTDSDHLLGLQRRRVIGEVHENTPAKKAGFQENDVIVEWAGFPNPTHSELREANNRNAGREIKVIVERNREGRVELRVTPKRAFKLFGQPGLATAGVSLAGSVEADGPVVAAVAKGSPAEALNLPRGSRLISIDGKPVLTWFDVAAAFKEAAGREIEVRYRNNDVEGGGRMKVPSSIVNEINLPDGAELLAIDGEETVKVPDGKGREIPFSIRHPTAARLLFSQKIGQEVKVRFSRSIGSDVEEATFRVREDNIDPWQMRVKYQIDTDRFEVLTELVSAHGNPWTALLMGVREAKRVTQMVFLSMTKLASRGGGADQVAGPVGIAVIGVQVAKTGLIELLFLLAFLSVNLAVINLLPVPVMDGGQMVFLLIEKIKGRPLNFKIQMWTTLAGLAAIILIGIVVTIQDFSRLF